MKTKPEKFIVIEKVGGKKDWGVVAMTEYSEGRWICGLSVITSIDEVLDNAEKSKRPIIFGSWLL